MKVNPSRRTYSAILASLLSLAFITMVHGEYRDFKNPAGDVIRAKLLSSSGNEVSMELENGRTVDTQLSFFSNEDQQFIKEWAVENPPALPDLGFEATFSVDKGDKEESMLSNGTVKVSTEESRYGVTLSHKHRSSISGLTAYYQIFKEASPYSKSMPSEELMKSGDLLVAAGEEELQPMATGREVEFLTASIPVSEFAGQAKGSAGSPKGMNEELLGVWVKVMKGDMLVFEAKSSESKLKDVTWLDGSEEESAE